MNMDRRQIKRIGKVHVTQSQKKRLLQLITKHPHLIRGSISSVTHEFNYIDAQRLWQQITRELNSIPGAKKTWKQWRKTWQDLRSKTKKQQKNLNGAIPTSVIMLTPAEQEALGLKNVGSAPVAPATASCQDTTEFVPLEMDSNQVNDFHVEVESSHSLSEPESPVETKVFTRPYRTKHRNVSSSSRHSDNCSMNCDLLAANEQRKLQLKEDFVNYKKDYLRKKLKLIKEQTEALKDIARALNER